MKKHILILATIIFAMGLYAKIHVPIATEIPDTTLIHNTTLIDPWSWMKNRDNPMLAKHLKQEKKYAERLLKSSQKLSNTLYKEFLKATSDETDSYPWFYKDYYYYTSTPKDKSYPLYYRKFQTLSAPAELILDCNILAKKKDYFDLGIYSMSPDQRYLAYAIDEKGNEDYHLYILDLNTRKTTDTKLSNLSDFLWYADSNHFLYIQTNDRWQSNTCYLATRDKLQPSLVYTETDPQFDLSLYYSTDKSRIYLLSYNKSCTEVFETRADDPKLGFHSFLPRKKDVVYYPDFFEGQYYIQSNHLVPESPIYTCSEDDAGIDEWQELIHPSDETPIDNYLILKNYLVVLQRYNGFDTIFIHDRETGKVINQYSPQTTSDLSFWHNPDPSQDSFTFTQENYLMPYSILQYTIPNDKVNQLYQYPVKIHRDYTKYHSEVLWVKAKDGKRIPLSIVYKETSSTSPRPLWLNGYGAYGSCEEPYFSDTRFSLLDRGVIFAVAHIRGGGELGDSWYKAGKKLNKMNSFTDFIACMDFLVNEGYTTYRQMVIEGGSAGGLLMGAVANLAPEKCRLVIADVPFVDALNTMLDPDLPLTVQEYEEWGNPEDIKVFDYIKSYSPYENISPKSYPAFLISAGWNDTRVGYWEALKWTQKLRKNQLSPHPIVFRLSYNEGHLGSGDRFASLRHYASTMAYALSLINPEIKK